MTSRWLLSLAVLVAAVPTFAQGPASLPIDVGETVMTHSAMSLQGSIAPGEPVVRLFDTRTPDLSTIPPGDNFVAPAFPDYFTSGTWAARDLGQVFGIALDDSVEANIYVTATSMYGIAAPRAANGGWATAQFGDDHPGSVMRIDGGDGTISQFAEIPNSGPALGQIAFDGDHTQFFVSSMDDGLIYRIDASGTIVSTYDHGLAASTCEDVPNEMSDDYDFFNNGEINGFTPRCRRVWGVQVWEGRLYYGTWRDDSGNADPSVFNEVWSVALDVASGDYVPNTTQLEITMPVLVAPAGAQDYSSPVSDIAISADGRMLVGERSMRQDLYYSGGGSAADWAHRGRVMEFELSGGTWTFVQQHDVGQSGQTYAPRQNNAGGVSWNGEVLDDNPDPGGCDSTAVASGHALNVVSQQSAGVNDYAYGFQTHPAAGSDTYWGDGAVNTLIVDYDSFLSGFDDKFQLGDVEARGPECRSDDAETCLEIVELTIDCLGEGMYQVTFQVTNTSPFSAPAEFIRVFMPDGTVLNLPLTSNGGNTNGVASGETSDPVTFTFQSAGDPGDEFCFVVQLVGQDRDGNGHPDWSCEKMEICLTLPDCPPPCIQFEGEVMQSRNGSITTASGTLLHVPPYNLGTDADHFSVVPLDPSVFVANATLNPISLPSNTTGAFQFDYVAIGYPIGSTLTFRIDLHGGYDPLTGEFEWCCSAIITLPVPSRGEPASIVQGTAFYDRDGDGEQDAIERGLRGVTVEAVDASGALVATTETDGSGSYLLEVSGAFGDVTLRVVPTDGWTATLPSTGVYEIDCVTETCAETSYPFGLANGVTTTNEPEASGGLVLHPAAPNPARGPTRVTYDLPDAGTVQLAIYDALGREVAVLASGRTLAGRHDATFDASSLPSGVYVVRLSTTTGVRIQRMTVLR